MGFNLQFDVSHLPFLFAAIIMAFTVHEYSHASLAYRFGDPTAYKLGRVTLNPMSHLSVLGLIFILLLGFGWARPVPVDRSNFRHPRLMGILVSAAGPVSNLMLAVLSAGLLYVLFASGALDGASQGVVKAAALFFFYLVHINVLLFLFNLIPLPPLDGYRIVEDLVPLRARLTMMRYEPWGVYIFLLIVFITPIFNVTIGPVLAQVHLWRNAILGFMEDFFGVSIDWVFVFSG